MRRKTFVSFSLKTLLTALLCFLLCHLSGAVFAATDMENLLPPNACGSGWKIDGKLMFYDRESLSDRINGEAELYFPYGFDRMAAARYASVKTPEAGIDVEIYRMGSLLDAFGMFANYRQKDGQAPAIGADANLSASQLFFYQGRHFIHIQTTGPSAASPETLIECGRAVASRLPGNSAKPPELAIFNLPETVKGSERYLPQSLLGYDFFNQGIMTDVVQDGANLQIFLLLDKSAATAAFDRYRAQLSQVKMETGGFLEGVDSLYGPVILLKKGGCLAGALKFGERKGIRALLERICIL